ncbi:hypothetical protein [Clostridium sp. MSTE9]|nr:hypothetical protein [Clostridium sp. MSTE9]
MTVDRLSCSSYWKNASVYSGLTAELEGYLARFSQKDGSSELRPFIFL